MSKQHEIRRLAMQILYQLDIRGHEDATAIRSGIDHHSKSEKFNQEAFELATTAWAKRHEADQHISELAPHWPTHRQPPLDRAILRLAYYEAITGRTPPGVAINEAVLLAKQYCAEQSPGFINGVLDKVVRKHDPRGKTTSDENHPSTC